MIDFDALVLAPAHATFGEANQGYPVPRYTPAGRGAVVDIDGVFHLEAIDVLAGGEMPGISTRKPLLDIRAAQLPPGMQITQGDTFQVRGVAYTVADVQPDGMGLIVLRLEEAPVA